MMKIDMSASLLRQAQRLSAPVPMQHVFVEESNWSAMAQAAAAGQAGRLVAMWATDGRPSGRPSVSAAYVLPAGVVWAELMLGDRSQTYPDLAVLFPPAGRMQRAIQDLCGVRTQDPRDMRPWLDHGVWPVSVPPLSSQFASGEETPERMPAPYAFVVVEGEGVHEIAVGPVHAGIIEPGHFRFSVVGEKVLRLEERLGYTHKGIEHRFTELPPLRGHRLAGRVSGDTTVGFAWAYCMALEGASDTMIPQRADWLRALMLERERVANHLGDLGALGNDAGFLFGAAQFSRLREDWLRLSASAFGHRLMMDCIVPGGTAADVEMIVRDEMRRQCDVVEAEVRRLRQIYDEHAGVQDRFMGAGRVTPELAQRLGLTGLAGRASGKSIDQRRDFPCGAYESLGVSVAVQSAGDVAARVAVRFDEVLESLRLIREICAKLPYGEFACDLVRPDGPARGAGWVEAWRGEVFVALELGGDGQIARCHCHDPSWQNWPVLEHAIMDNIVPDFPLINKSFNLSYSGHDL